jgi:D-hexose-6-phosphate mutarotase
VDRVYASVAGKLVVKYTNSSGGFEIVKEGLPDVDVWNPAEKGKTIGDMEEGGVDKVREYIYLIVLITH